MVPSAGLSAGVWELGQEAMRAGDIGAQIGLAGVPPSGEDPHSDLGGLGLTHSPRPPPVLRCWAHSWPSYIFAFKQKKPVAGLLLNALGFFWPHSVPGIEPVPPAMEAQSLNLWTTREVLSRDVC